MDRLKGKRALINGGATGIGQRLDAENRGCRPGRDVLTSL